MRRIIFVTVFFFIFIIDVNASDTYYTEYSNFQTYSGDLYIEDDLINVEKKRMYKYYQEEISGDYFIYGNNPFEYPNLDQSKYTVTPFTEWSNELPNEHPYRTIEIKDVYRYQEMKEVRYIHFNNFFGGNGKLNITEIIVLAGDKKIDYTVYCDRCSNNFDAYINNDVIHENNSYVSIDGYIRLDLAEYYPLDSLEIKVYLYDTTTEEKRINIYITRDQELKVNDNVYVYNMVRSFFTHNETGDIHELVFDIDFVLFVNPEYTEFKYSDTPLSNTKTRSVIKTKMYRYQDLKFYYYGINRVYLDGYYENYPGYIKDYEQYLDYYRYQVRDRIVIGKEINIKDSTTKIDDFIDATSDYKIIGEIDYDKNGKYEIDIIFGDLIIKRLVRIDNVNNAIENIENLINDLKESSLQDNHNNFAFLEYDLSPLEKKYDELLILIKEREFDIDEEKRSLLEIDSKINIGLLKLSESVEGMILDLERKLEQLLKTDGPKIKPPTNTWLIISIFLVILLAILIIKKYRINNNSSFVESV